MDGKQLDTLIQGSLTEQIRLALAEDIGSGDITAQLIPSDQAAKGHVITREKAVICGRLWVDEVFRQVDPAIILDWLIEDGEEAEANAVLFRFQGPARSLLTAERTALNYLQTLSATATESRRHARLVAHTSCRILDTRKTLPHLRLAQKYAVRCGGCQNHRLGLWDAFLIKENHIMACGSIASAVRQALTIAPGRPVEVEIEYLSQLEEAIEAGATIVMLDNFTLEDMREAVSSNKGRVKLEASGGIGPDQLMQIAETGVDFISIGSLTKHCRAIDLSMRLEA